MQRPAVTAAKISSFNEDNKHEITCVDRAPPYQAAPQIRSGVRARFAQNPDFLSAPPALFGCPHDRLAKHYLEDKRIASEHAPKKISLRHFTLHPRLAVHFDAYHRPDLHTRSGMTKMRVDGRGLTAFTIPFTSEAVG